MPVEGIGWTLQIWEQSFPLFSISSLIHLYCEQYLQFGSIFISSLVPNLAVINRCIRTYASNCYLLSRYPRSTINPSTFFLSSSRSRLFCSLDVLRLMPSCSPSLDDELSDSSNFTFPSSSLITTCPFFSSLFFSPLSFLITGFLPRLLIFRICSYYSRLTSASRLAFSLTTFGLFLRFLIFFYLGTPRLRGSSFSNSFLCLFCFFFDLFIFFLSFSDYLYVFCLGLRPLRTGSSSSFSYITHPGLSFADQLLSSSQSGHSQWLEGRKSCCEVSSEDSGFSSFLHSTFSSLYQSNWTGYDCVLIEVAVSSGGASIFDVLTSLIHISTFTSYFYIDMLSLPLSVRKSLFKWQSSLQITCKGKVALYYTPYKIVWPIVVGRGFAKISVISMGSRKNIDLSRTG